MTDVTDAGRRDELARKIVRVRALCDPLGAKGQRQTGERIRRESRARRGLFAAAFASFVACFGIVAVTAGAPEEATVTAAPPAIVTEAPLNDGRGTRGSLLHPPATHTPRPHVRTRATTT